MRSLIQATVLIPAAFGFQGLYEHTVKSQEVVKDPERGQTHTHLNDETSVMSAVAVNTSLFVHSGRATSLSHISKFHCLLSDSRFCWLRTSPNPT